MRRFIVLAFLFVPLLWATWGWQPLAPESNRSLIRFETLTRNVSAAERGALGAFKLEHLWQMSSDNRRFGGYSALVLLPSGQFLAASDRNSWLRFTLPQRDGTAIFPLGSALVRRTWHSNNESFDVEAAVRDPVDGSLWIGLENNRNIARIGRRGGLAELTKIEALRDWPENGGAEALARLADGRWIMLCETCGGGRGGLHLGLLFAGHPGKSPATKFGIVLPAGFDPVDMVPLPDGRVLILTRSFGLFPPRFVSRIVLADFARLDVKRPLATQELARIEGRGVRENYEGMAIRKEADGSLTLWLISDANGLAFQQTRLMQLRLDPAKLPPVP